MNDILSQIAELGATVPDEEKPSISSNFAAAASLQNDLSQGMSYTDIITSALKQQNSVLQQKKADIAQRMATGQQLTPSQAVGLTMLTALPVIIGGLMRGKRGAAKGAEASQVGLSMLYKDNAERQLRQDKADTAAMENIDSQIAANQKMATEAMMDDLKATRKEAHDITMLDEKKARGMGGGVTINNVPGPLVKGELPADTQKELIKLEGAAGLGESIAKKLEQLPSDLQGTITNQISKRFTATDRGKIESNLKMYQRILQGAIEGKRGSDQDNAIFEKIVSGDFTASPADQASLIRQANDALRRIALGEIETYQELGTPEGVERFKTRLRGDGAADPAASQESLIREEIAGMTDAQKLAEIERLKAKFGMK